MDLEINPELKIYKLYEEDELREFTREDFNHNFVINKPKPVDESNYMIALVEEESKAVCYVEYKYIDDSEIEGMINNGQELYLAGRYIRDFDIKKLSLQNDCKINGLDAKYSYWEEVRFDFAKFTDCKVDFYNSIFVGYIGFGFLNFVNCDVTFDCVNFGEANVSFLLVNFEKSNISFYDAISQNVIIFFRNSFEGDIDLRFNGVNKLIIYDCKVKSTMRIGGKPDELSFTDTINLGHIDLDWEENNVKKAIENTHGKVSRDGCKGIAKDFVMLKENYRRAGQYEWEDASHRAYMEYNTKALKWFSKEGIFKKPFLKLFGAISGYGTKVTSILLSCIGVIFGFAFAYLNAFLEAQLSFFQSLYFSAITFLTIGYGDLSPMNYNFSWFQTLCTGVEGFLGLLLMSLVTVVIARKLIR